MNALDNRNVLVIPAEGLLSRFHTERDFDEDYYKRIIAKEMSGDYARVEVVRDGQRFQIGMFINSSSNRPNHRARKACAAFFGWHMVFEGNVFIAGLSYEETEEIVKELT